LIKKYENRWTWHEAMKEEIDRALTGCYPRNWNEDYITRLMISSIRDQFSNTEIAYDKAQGKRVKTSWDVYKNTGTHNMEHRHGDIGILVKLDFGGGRSLEGAAFVEAKRIYHNELDDRQSKYEKLDWSQSARVSSNSACHRTLLYDYVTYNNLNKPFALTLPTNHLMALGEKSREIYPYCEHFSYCLINRYFQGYELDYARPAVDAVKGFLNEYQGVDYLLISHVVLSQELQPTLESIEFNHKIFERLIKPELEPEPSKGQDNGPSNFSK